jgi:hypothetical protein
MTNRPEEIFEWDAFISHATEDKDSFVRELAQELVREGITVWYDEFTLRVGDSLRRSIEKGLSNSRYGIVVLSPSFFRKEWPQSELDGLVTRERNGEKVILPVWLDVDREAVAQYSLILADRVAVKANEGMDKVVAQLLLVLNPSSFSQQSVPTKHKRAESVEKENTSSKGLISPKLLSTIIYFEEDDGEKIKGEMFAVLVNWIDYEQVEDKLIALKFPGGTFESIGGMQTLTVYPSNLPLQEIIRTFGKVYRMIEFTVDKQFDFGDLVRRSRGGIRPIGFLSKKTMTFTLDKWKANLSLTNTSEGSIITIRTTGKYYAFISGKSPIPYSAVLSYLQKDPPTEELENYLRDTIL